MRILGGLGQAIYEFVQARAVGHGLLYVAPMFVARERYQQWQGGPGG